MTASKSTTSPSLPPPHLLILPQHAKPASPSNRILTLPHPRTSVPSRYLFCPPPSPQDQQQQQQTTNHEAATSSLYEFTRVTDTSSPSVAGGRSWLIKTHDAGAGGRQMEGQSGGRKRKRGEEAEGGEDNDKTRHPPSGEGEGDRKREDRVIKRGALLIATPMDPLFLLLPLLFSLTDRQPQPRRHFLPLDDILDPLTTPPEEEEDSASEEEAREGAGDGKGRGPVNEKAKEGEEARAHWTFLLQQPAFRVAIEERVAAVCDTVAAGDETVYRVSEGKLLQEMLRKAQRMLEVGRGRMPRSVEERFVRRRLAAPVIALMEESQMKENGAVVAAASGANESQGESQDSSAASFTESNAASAGTGITTPETGGSQDQEMDKTAITDPKAVAESGLQGTTTSTSASTDEDNNNNNNNNNKITHLLRLHTCLTYILTAYLTPPLSKHLLSLLKSTPSPPTIPEIPNFNPLHQHLTHLDSLRAKAYAARSLSDFSRTNTFQKRSSDLLDDDDDDAAAAAAAAAARAKKAKLGAAGTGESRATKQLKKVDVSGMRKIDGFFSKKPATAAVVGGVRRSPRKK